MSKRTVVADILRDAGDQLHALARKIDPPEYGVKIVYDEFYETGEYVTLGVIAVERDRAGVVRETDIPASLWGIVTPSEELGAVWPPLGGHDATTVWDLDELSGHLRTLADEIIAEAKP